MLESLTPKQQLDIFERNKQLLAAKNTSKYSVKTADNFYLVFAILQQRCERANVNWRNGPTIAIKTPGIAEIIKIQHRELNRSVDRLTMEVSQEAANYRHPTLIVIQRRDSRKGRERFRLLGGIPNLQNPVGSGLLIRTPILRNIEFSDGITYDITEKLLASNSTDNSTISVMDEEILHYS